MLAETLGAPLTHRLGFFYREKIKAFVVRAAGDIVAGSDPRSSERHTRTGLDNASHQYNVDPAAPAHPRHARVSSGMPQRKVRVGPAENIARELVVQGKLMHFMAWEIIGRYNSVKTHALQNGYDFVFLGDS